MSISNRKGLFTGIFIIFVILLIAYVAYNSAYKGQTTTTSTVGLPSTTSITLTTSIPSYLSGGGYGQSFMSSPEASTLIGSTSSYQGEQLTQSQMASYVNGSIKGQPSLSFLMGNVSAIWAVSARSPSGALNEVVYQSKVSSRIYKFYTVLLSNGTYPVKSLNLTVNGLTYSYYQAGSGSGTSAYLVGIKGNEVAYLSLNGAVSGKIQSAAPIVTNDTP